LLAVVDAEKFWASVDRRSPDGCWEWAHARSPLGYGKAHIGRGHVTPVVLAHRVAWALANGEIPDGLLVLHRCDNPPCCNPAHLFLGTHEDNMRDMRSKGRSNVGVRHPLARFSDEAVRAIRAARRRGISVAAIAQWLGVPRSRVSRAATGRRWAHLPGGVAPQRAYRNQPRTGGRFASVVPG